MKSEYRSAKKRRIANERKDQMKSDISDDNNSNDSSNLRSDTIMTPKFYEIKEGENLTESNSNKLGFVQNSK